MWHLLQISGPLDRELGAALSAHTSLTGWEPERVSLPRLGSAAPELQPSADPRLLVRRVSLLRGFARWPLSLLARTGPSVCRQLLSVVPGDREPVLLCTSPFFTSVAERWPGPVVYWLSDLMARYGYARFEQVAQLDERLCRIATLVCPNSERIAAYLREKASCQPAKICLLPNATRASNLLPAPAHAPAALPWDLNDLPRPVAGVIGNLASNMDWQFLEHICARSPQLSLALVGPTSMAIDDPEQSEARQRVLGLPQVRSVGPKSYGELVHYARSFDVALLPYRRVEPTFSGSSTRFYEHLAAGRPMIATSGFAELHQKQPLLTLVDTAEEAVAALERLEALGFDDGLAGRRWSASQLGTWEERASTLLQALAQRRRQTAPGLAEQVCRQSPC